MSSTKKSGSSSTATTSTFPPAVHRVRHGHNNNNYNANNNNNQTFVNKEARKKTSSPATLHILQQGLFDLDNRSSFGETSTSAAVAVQMTTAKTTIVIYPTVAPETVIVPILCSICIFPIVAACIIFTLRHYNRRARAKDKFRSRRRGCQMHSSSMCCSEGMAMAAMDSSNQEVRSAYRQGASAIFSLTKIGTSQTVGQKKTTENEGSSAKKPIRPFQCMPELELDTVLEERDDDEDDEDDEEDEEEEEDEEDDIVKGGKGNNCIALQVLPVQQGPNTGISSNHVVLEAAAASIVPNKEVKKVEQEREEQIDDR